MNIEQPKKYIDIRDVIKKKNPKLLKWIPNALTSFLERLVHIDDINIIMTRYADKRGLEFVDGLIEYLGASVTLVGQENIPLEDSVIFASNHPLGGLDGVAFMYAIGKHRQDVKFLVNDILMNVENLQPLFVPVNKVGGQGRSQAMAIQQAYAAKEALLVFPAGLVSRKQSHGVMDLQWQKSFINKAKKYKKDVVPVYIEGENSNFFYNLSRWRRKLGIKTNLEMLVLPHEMFSARNKNIIIRIGKPISYTYFDKSKEESTWAEEVKQLVYSMAPEK
ncbi:1-acyl-sn-glycerol-3-phosphate acyltransferase [Sphingobacteriaceae bacterium WQ 2009]|uniref:1-acyl-sn-glycerol-3-phosphate acyltransferase n=1 Tax=Rhinopithecimicrobium faecis TaxID=2820698 RepID=A0A8T4HCS8_9SPHI|nr:1-acyl-sn-glycerol-3-phosphate acyltransferase [Sphingobacteriaceae bacterium WQ 2009]